MKRLTIDNKMAAEDDLQAAQGTPEDKRDAERYRWLRDKHEWYECYITGTLQTKFDAKYETLDEAIDAAMNTRSDQAGATPKGKERG